MEKALKKHEHQDAGTRAELEQLKQHVAVLSQAVMALMRRIASSSQPPAAPPQGQPNPALLQRMAQIAAARRAQAAQGAPPQGMPPQGPMPPQMGARPPGMAVGGLQMGLNRLEPTGAFSRGIAHSLTPSAMRFHSPHPPRMHLAMGGMPGSPGMPGMRPTLHPALAALAARYTGMR